MLAVVFLGAKRACHYGEYGRFMSSTNLASHVFGPVVPASLPFVWRELLALRTRHEVTIRSPLPDPASML